MEKMYFATGKTQEAAVVEVKVKEHDQQNALQSCQTSYHPIVYPGPPRRILFERMIIIKFLCWMKTRITCVGHGFKVNERHADVNCGKISFARSDMVNIEVFLYFLIICQFFCKCLSFIGN